MPPRIVNSLNQPSPSGIEHRILDNLATAVLLFDASLCLSYINPAGEMLFAVSARHILGGTVSGVLPCPDKKVEEKLRRALTDGHPFTEREMPLALPDSREIRVNCSVQPLYHAEAPNEILVELHQVDRHLRISREEQLIVQHQAVQALVRGLAHEIKNPLGGLRGAAQLLEQELPDPALHDYTRIIIEEADRLQALMNRMLGPNRPPKRRLVNIHEILERVVGLVRAESGPLLCIERDYDPSIPELSADPDQLIQAFLNILRNAAHAVSDAGRVRIRTRVLRQFTLGQVRHRLVLQVEIEDNGPGIGPQLLDRIFYPMISGGNGGTGLGLPIAQNLINRHAGLIECQSKPGETLFTVYLPLESSHG